MYYVIIYSYLDASELLSLGISREMATFFKFHKIIHKPSGKLMQYPVYNTLCIHSYFNF